METKTSLPINPRTKLAIHLRDLIIDNLSREAAILLKTALAENHPDTLANLSELLRFIVPSASQKFAEVDPPIPDTEDWDQFVAEVKACILSR